MVCVQDENAVQSALKHGVDHVFFARHTKHHAQEIASIGQVVLGVHEGLTDAVFVGHGHQGRQFGNQANGRNIAVFWIVDVSAVVIKSRQGTHQACKHSHRMCVTTKATQEKLHLLIDHGVVVHQLMKARTLCGVWQVAF